MIVCLNVVVPVAAHIYEADHNLIPFFELLTFALSRSQVSDRDQTSSLLESPKVEVDLPMHRMDVDPPTTFLCPSIFPDPCPFAFSNRGLAVSPSSDFGSLSSWSPPSGSGFAHAAHGSGSTYYILVSTNLVPCHFASSN